MNDSVVKILNNSLKKALKENPRVIILGEDIVDPYGGAFKVTRGLSTEFPERVITTPISEASIIGIAAGMALKGLQPIVEIMFGDFITLGADQIINHIAKYRWMYNDKVQIPLVIRTPMGGGKGYGPTHSQSLEKIYMGVPGIRIIAINRLIDPGLLLENAIEVLEPVIFIENKQIYPQKLITPEDKVIGEFSFSIFGKKFPTAVISTDKKSMPDVTIVTYGGILDKVLEAAYQVLIDKEWITEIILLSHIKPFPIAPIIDSVSKSRRLITVEEGTPSFGWGREIVYQVLNKINSLSSKPLCVGAKGYPIANTKVLEDAILPQNMDILNAVRSSILS